MRTILITRPQTDVRSRANWLKLQKLGYNPERFFDDSGELSNLRIQESKEWIDKRFKSHVDSLRANWRNLLLSVDDEWVLFGEEDMLPKIECEVLENLLKKKCGEDVDVFRLHHKLKREPFSSVVLYYGFDFINMECPKNSWMAWGTHALFVPRKSRKKIAKFFDEYFLPTDTTLEYLNSKKKIEMRISSVNLFTQLI